MTTLINKSHEPDWRITQWLRTARALEAASVVVSLPDTCPGRSPLPTGTGFLTKDAEWRRFAVSDVGCGMCIVRTGLTQADTQTASFRHSWTRLCESLRSNRNRGLGDLGSGNHFLDAAVSHADSSACLIVHTGSRTESGLVDDLVDSPKKFDSEFLRIRRWAFDNRRAVLDIAERELGRYIPLYQGVARLDRDHNHFEETDDGIVIRKGSQRVTPGELALIPSNLLDDMVIVRAGKGVADQLNCLPHGTGRSMSRSDAKAISSDEALNRLRSTVYIPESIENASLRTELPECYRNLDDGLKLIADQIEVVERLTPVAYIGQL